MTDRARMDGRDLVQSSRELMERVRRDCASAQAAIDRGRTRRATSESRVALTRARRMIEGVRLLLSARAAQGRDGR